MAKNEQQESYYRRPDLHFVWIGLPIAILVGAGAWLGVPGLIIPMALLIIAWVIAGAYVFVMIPISRLGKFVIVTLVSVLFLGIGWSFWHVFTVNAKVRFISGSAYPSGGEEARFAVELTNRGKATSLKNWRAQLIDRNGQIFDSEPLTMVGDSVEIVGADHLKVSYALPECDLRFETARALQTGDSVYGIVDVLFRGYPQQTIPLDVQVRLTATDMLGRKVTTGETKLSEINSQPTDVFPCRTSKQP